ncbi:hypothetical protein KKG46_04450 [Patescibacteria group bacterium]|nr:hypothetical protein [Patescibacteria group bacterium]
MKCKNCGNTADVNEKYCTGCGKEYPFSSNLNNESIIKEAEPATSEPSKPTNSTAKTAKKSNKWLRLGIALLIMIGIGIYGSLDDKAIETNDKGIDSFVAGDSESAIASLIEARDSAVTDDTKLNTNKNLGYVYSTEERYDDALAAFKEALKYADKNSLDYYLVSAEINLLEKNFQEAENNFLAAYNKDPNDYQANNSLALFYLDLDDWAPEFVDYPKALVHAQKSYEQGGEDLYNITQMNLAIAHFFNDNYGETIRLLADYDYSAHPYAAFWTGLAYWAKGDTWNAKTYIKLAMNNGAEVPDELYQAIMVDEAEDTTTE